MTKNHLAYRLKSVQHYYGSTKVLDIDDLKIEKGSITGLIGPNGSGKSTLLKLLAFAQKPSMGQIFYNGNMELPFSLSIRSKITLLTQKPYLLKRTVFENIVYGLKIRKEKNDLEQKVSKALLNVGLDYQKFAGRFWNELSGGEAQRVAMAARLILKPEVLLLDEPVANVDTESASLIRQASLNARKNWGTTLVIASHDLQWLYSISDQQLSIFKGNIFSTGIENIITGPFEKSGKKNLKKKLGDGQVITLSAPAKALCTAIIRKKDMSIHLEKHAGKSHFNQLAGIISSMLLEKKSKTIMASISIQDLSFTLKLSPDKIGQLDLYPGKKVFLKFAPGDVDWI